MTGTNTSRTRSSWSVAADFPEHLKSGEAFALTGNRILLFDTTGKSTSAIFDIHNQTTVATPRFNYALRHKGAAHCVAKQGQNLYLCTVGGCLSSGTVTNATQAFDLTFSKWHPIANLRTARHGAVCLRHEDHIYVFGGIGKEGELNETAEVLKWDDDPPSQNEEIRMHTPRSNAAAVSLRDEIFLLGGEVMSASQSGRETANSMVQFNTTSHHWKDCPAMTFARKDPLAVPIADRAIVVMGGTDEDGQLVREVEIFDVERQTWILWGIFHDPRPGLSGCAFGTDVYVYCREKLELWKLQLRLNDLGEPEAGARTSAGACADVDERRPSNDFVFEAPFSSPTRPQVQAAQDVRGRVLALQKWISSMKRMKQTHEAAVADTIHHIEESFNKQRDLEIFKVQQKAQAWLDETDRLIADAQEQITTNLELVEQHNLDKARLSEIGANSGVAIASSRPPRELCCPITLEVMKDPVLAADGNTYEREALDRWFAKQPSDKKLKSPMTGSEMESRSYFPNHVVRSLCQHFH